MAANMKEHNIPDNPGYSLTFLNLPEWEVENSELNGRTDYKFDAISVRKISNTTVFI